MKNQGKEEEYIRQFIAELGTDTPSEGFHKSIMKKINPKTSLSYYRPVISSLTWKIIGGTIAILFIAVILFVPNGSDVNFLFNQLPGFSLPELAISLPKVSFPVIDVSPIVLQSLVAFMLLAFLTVVTSMRRWKAS